jgi:hypothetical protein
MAVLKYLSPKEKRAELEVFGKIGYAIWLYNSILYFYVSHHWHLYKYKVSKF